MQILKQMLKVAARNGWIANPGIWDDVKVKSVVGVNTKVVEPLPVDLQRKMLEKIRGMRPEHFKAGFEEAIKERKELVEWLAGGYFGE
jgi:hypothetical protein